MFEWLSQMENTKPLALVIFFVTFLGIILYVFTGKKRSRRLEAYKNIPFLDDDASATGQAGKVPDKDQDNG